MSDPGNAREVSGTGADYMGFIFYPGSKRYVGRDPDKSLFSSVPGKILKVGVFVNEKTAELLRIARKYSLELVQLHGAETPADCRTIRSAGFGVIKSFGIEPDFNFDALASYIPEVDHFLFDTRSDHHGGTGTRFNWEILDQYDFEKSFFLSGGIGPDHAEEILAFQHPSFHGVDINSRFEIFPGVKDIDKLKTFITHIKSRKT